MRNDNLNKALKKGVKKLAAFAIDFKPENGNRISIDVSINGLVKIWIWSKEIEIIAADQIYFPKSDETIDNFFCVIETTIAEIKRDHSRGEK